jgi:V8-like Glu-specific endopeptidase
VRRHVGRAWLLALLALAVGGWASPAAASHESERRVRLGQLDQPPHSGTVAIAIRRAARCAGILVRRDKVVTAAHCLVRDAEDGDLRLVPDIVGRIVVVPGYSASHTAYRACGAESVWANPGYVRRDGQDRVFGRLAADFAVITLSCRYDASQVLGLATSSCAGEELGIGTPISTSGYPYAQRRSDAMDGEHLWVTTGHVRTCVGTPGLLDFTDYTAPGMSGGPAWVRGGTEVSCGHSHCVAAIITRGGYGDGGQGVRITSQVRRTILSH